MENLPLPSAIFKATPVDARSSAVTIEWGVSPSFRNRPLRFSAA
jgi:hypothetical protein